MPHSEIPYVSRGHPPQPAADSETTPKHTISFCLTDPLCTELLRVKSVTETKLLEIVEAALLRAWTPFLSSNEQHQSTEG